MATVGNNCQHRRKQTQHYGLPTCDKAESGQKGRILRVFLLDKSIRAIRFHENTNVKYVILELKRQLHLENDAFFPCMTDCISTQTISKLTTMKSLEILYNIRKL